jgi:hypothetical protein
MHGLYKWLSVFLLSGLMACAPKTAHQKWSPEESGKEVSPYPAPAATTILQTDHVIMNLTFRSESGVPISDTEPMVLQIADEEYRCELSGHPGRSIEPDKTVVDRAAYHLPMPIYRRLIRVSPDSVTIHVHDNHRYWAYPYRSADFIE